MPQLITDSESRDKRSARDTVYFFPELIKIRELK